MARQVRILRRLQRPERPHVVSPDHLPYRPDGLPDGPHVMAGSAVWTSPPLPVPFPQIRRFTLIELPGVPWALRIVTYTASQQG